jgi:hypothetical protein
MQLMSLRKKDPLTDGCFIYDERIKSAPGPYMVMKDSHYADNQSGWQSLDMTGRGYFAAVAYKYSLINADDMRKEVEREQRIAQYDVQTLARTGKVDADVVRLDETVVINGLTWRHRLTANYKTSDPTDASKGELLEWRETYEHPIDSTHVLRQVAHYDAMIVADPEWISARRALLRKMVEAVRLEKMTQAEVDAAVANYARQRDQERNNGKQKRR